MAQDTPSRKLDQYIVRFPDGMRDELKRVAGENGRSLNAEIIHRLDVSLKGITPEEVSRTDRNLQILHDALVEVRDKLDIISEKVRPD